MMIGKTIFELLVEFNALCAGRALNDTERLEVLELAWLTTAANARHAALALPGAFPAEQARQLNSLETMAQLVREDTPDLEAERLFQEGDVEGLSQHYRDQIDQLKGGAR